jgi:hypothetical protein
MFQPVKRAIFILLALLGCAGGSVPQTAGDAGLSASSDAGPAPTAGCRTDDDCDPGDFCIEESCIGDSATAPEDAGTAASADAGQAAPPDAGQAADGGLPVQVITVGPDGGTVDLLDFVFTGDTRPVNCWTAATDSSNPYPAAAFQQIVARMGSLSPQFAFDLGDHMYECNENLADAQSMMGKYTQAIANAGFKPTWFMTMGNHECGAGSTADCSAHPADANAQAYLSALSKLSQQPLPYYKVDVQTRLGLARFVFIADNWYSATAQAWVESTLADADLHAKYTIIVKHHPIAVAIGSLREGPTWSYDLITSGRHKYSLVLTAHTHDYEHPTGAFSGRSVICGLGAANTSFTGFCRVQQQADGTLKFTAYDLFGNVRTDPSPAFTVTPQ